MTSEPALPNAPDISPRAAALIAGTGLLSMSILAPMAHYGIVTKMVVAGNAAITARVISGASGHFRIAISFLFIVAILDVMVAWALYLLFRRVARSLSLLAAVFRIVYATMLAVALNSLLTALDVSDAAEPQLRAQVLVSARAFRTGWDLGLIVFGLHLLVLGVVIFLQHRRLRALGVLVGSASLGYLVDGFGKLLSGSYALNIAAFTFFGEVVLMSWLLYKGISGRALP